MDALCTQVVAVKTKREALKRAWKIAMQSEGCLRVEQALRGRSDVSAATRVVSQSQTHSFSKGGSKLLNPKRTGGTRVRFCLGNLKLWEEHGVNADGF